MSIIEVWQQYKDLEKLQITKEETKEAWHIHFQNGGEDYEKQGEMVLALMSGTPIYADTDDFERLEAFYTVSKKDNQLQIWKGEVAHQRQQGEKLAPVFRREAVHEQPAAEPRFGRTDSGARRDVLPRRKIIAGLRDVALQFAEDVAQRRQRKILRRVARLQQFVEGIQRALRVALQAFPEAPSRVVRRERRQPGLDERA